jgi:hypothetical protein
MKYLEQANMFWYRQGALSEELHFFSHVRLNSRLSVSVQNTSRMRRFSWHLPMLPFSSWNRSGLSYVE